MSLAVRLLVEHLGGVSLGILLGLPLGLLGEPVIGGLLSVAVIVTLVLTVPERGDDQ